MRQAYSRVFLVSVAVIGFAPVATAASQWGTQPEPQSQSQSRPTVLSVSPPAPLPLGERIDLTARLTNREGEVQGNKVIVFYLDGRPLRRARTEADGTATIRVGGDLPIGSFELTVSFIGTKDYLPASATVPLTVRPAVLTIETVPPTPDVPFRLNEQTFFSDSRGVARTEIVTLGDYELEQQLEPETKVNAYTRVNFLRWADATFTSDRTLELRGDAHLSAGFALSHLVQAKFRNLSDDPVAWSRVSSLTLKGSNGTFRTLTDGKPHWLQVNRVSRTRDGLEVAPLQYSVESVMIDGANVVNKYQQRFFVEPKKRWDIELLLYSASIRATDALFGFPIGTGVSMTYPDGHTRTLAFGPSDEVHVGPLARGLYQLQVTGASGVAPPTPVALSRDQEVELKVLSALDIGSGVSLGLFLALGLLFYGRPRLLGLGRRKAASARPNRGYSQLSPNPSRSAVSREGGERR